MIAHILDVKLLKVAKKYKMSYSRYADDLTFSTNLRVFPEEIGRKMQLEESGGEVWVVGEMLERTIQSEGFCVNHKKTRLSTKVQKQQVTTLVVNKKVNVDKRYYHYTRSMVNGYCANGGFFCSKLHRNAYKEHRESRANSLRGGFGIYLSN